MPHPPTDKAATLQPFDLSPEEVLAELEDVLRSAPFERSEKLQRFLRFICELTLRGEGGSINEYLIGSEVFLRGPNYSPNEDSVVRRQAHTLRQKLNEFYAAEGSTHPVRIELPVGRYVPMFRRLPVPETAAAPLPENTAPAAIPHPLPARFSLSRLLLPAAAVALLLAGVLAGTRLNPAPAPIAGPATLEIWGPWSQPGRAVFLCFSSPMTAVIKHFEDPLPADTLPERHRVHPEHEQLYRDSFSLPAGGAFYFTPAVNQTKLGEAIAGVQLTALLTRLHVPLESTQSRFLTWEDLRSRDLILLGNNEANRWLDPLLTDTPFQLTPSAGKRQRAIVNRRPLPGEPPEYIINYGSGEQAADQEYALVSMLPGMSAQQRLLLISGLNAQATQAATEYLADESSLGELLARLRQQSPSHVGPWHFQAILKAEVHDKVPTKVRLIAVRTL